MKYNSFDEFYAAASDPNRQEELLSRFIQMKGSRLQNALQTGDFDNIARYYNGEAQISSYSPKIKAYYEQCKRSGTLNCDEGEGNSGPA